MGKRKDDDHGPSLGEKVHIWLSSAKILYTLIPVLLGASVYGNSDTVRNRVNHLIGVGDIPIAGGEVVTPTSEEDDAFKAQVRQSLASIVSKLEDHEGKIENLHGMSAKYDSGLQEQIDALKAWHE